MKANDGKIQYGWIIWEIPEIFIEAEFHAVWINNDGDYLDITPKSDGEERILFLLDSKKKFDGKLIDNIRKPLVDNAHTRTMVKFGKKKFEVESKYFTGDLNYAIPNQEIEELERYRESTLSSEIQRDKLDGKIKVGRNESCPCGSGIKYKKCCMGKC